MLCVEIPQMQCIDLSELIHVLKAFTIVTSEPLNLYRRFLRSVTFDALWLLRWSMHEWRLNPEVEGAQEKCPFPLNRGVRSKEVTNTKIIWRFCRDQILCPLNGGVPAWMQVSQRLHCTRLCRKMGQKLSPKLFHDMIRLRTTKLWPKHFRAPIWQTWITLISRLRQMVKVNLYYVTQVFHLLVVYSSL